MRGANVVFGRGCLAVAATFALLMAGTACQTAEANNGSRSAGLSIDETLPSSAEPSVSPERYASPGPDALPTGNGGLLPLPADAQAARVDHHTDGDTLALRAYVAGRVLSSTSQITVRLLEIDTPETKKPGTPVQCYGPQASAELARLAPLGAMVYVAADKDRTDPYGRDLLYLWDAEGRSVNLAMIEGGFARAVLYPPNDRYIAVLRNAEAMAKTLDRGLWAACPVPAPPAPVTASKRAPAPPTTRNCDPAYPTVCVPPAPPDLDCGQISYRRFTVLAPDRHGFDADHDGIGCESG